MLCVKHVLPYPVSYLVILGPSLRHPRRRPGISYRKNAFSLQKIPAYALRSPHKSRPSLFVVAVNVSCALTHAVICAVHRTRPTRGAQSPSPRDPWLFAGNNAAYAVPSGPEPTDGPPATRSRRGADFRGVLPLTLWSRSPQRYFLRDITSNNSKH